MLHLWCSLTLLQLLPDKELQEGVLGKPPSVQECESVQVVQLVHPMPMLNLPSPCRCACALFGLRIDD